MPVGAQQVYALFVPFFKLVLGIDRLRLGTALYKNLEI